MGGCAERQDRLVGKVPPRKQAGYTLLEVVIVVAILGIIAGVALPGIIGGIRRTGVEGAARRVTEDIRLAQATALARGAQTRLIAVDKNGLVIIPGGTNFTNTGKANMYRIEAKAGSWPPITDDPSNPSVVTAWNALASDYKGVTITTGNTLVFNTQGFLISGTPPLDIVVEGPGGTKIVRTNIIGRASIQ